MAVLPTMKAQLLEQVAADAIRTAFHPTTSGFASLIDRLLVDHQRLNQRALRVDCIGVT